MTYLCSEVVFHIQKNSYQSHLFVGICFVLKDKDYNRHHILFKVYVRNCLLHEYCGTFISEEELMSK